jgi:hypothetical protein
VLPLPGASSVTCALSAAGLAGDGSFVFEGFLPSKSGERAAAVQALAQQTRAVVLLEAPHRIAALADALAALGQRPVTVARELTKQFEQIATLACADLPAWLAADAQRQRGEFALVLHPAEAATGEDESERVLQAAAGRAAAENRREAGGRHHRRRAMACTSGRWRSSPAIDFGSNQPPALDSQAQEAIIKIAMHGHQRRHDFRRFTQARPGHPRARAAEGQHAGAGRRLTQHQVELLTTLNAMVRTGKHWDISIHGA